MINVGTGEGYFDMTLFHKPAYLTDNQRLNQEVRLSAAPQKALSHLFSLQYYNMMLSNELCGKAFVVLQLPYYPIPINRLVILIKPSKRQFRCLFLNNTNQFC